MVLWIVGTHQMKKIAAIIKRVAIIATIILIAKH
jgi:hypothetical protein